MRAQVEDPARAAAVTALTAFARLREPSAANVAATLDIALDDRFRAAAATAMLVEAAEVGGEGRVYIDDALAQLAFRSPVRRIDVVGPEEKTVSLRDANRQLTAAQARMNQDLSLARRVQHALVPTGTQVFGILEFSSRMTPVDDRGALFGEERLLSRAFSGSGDPKAPRPAPPSSGALVDLVWSSVASFSGSEPPTDDKTILVLRRSSSV